MHEHDKDARSLRVNETSGMFAASNSLLVGVAHDPARDQGAVRARPPHLEDNLAGVGVLSLLPDRLSASECSAHEAARSCEEPQANNFSDFLRLVAATRAGDTEWGAQQGQAPAGTVPCYGGGISGTGDVEAPASATDNAIARYDGASGKLIQSSAVLVDNKANVTGASSMVLTEQASAPLPVAAGEGMFWSKADTPTAPYFTDDTGTDHELMAGNNNLKELTAPATARSNLGLGSLAVKNSVATGDIDANAVTDAKLRDSAALSVIGRSANSTGDPADIAAGSDHQVLRRSGTTIGFGAVNLAQSAAVTGALPIANGGTGATQARDALSNLGTLKSTVIEYTGSGASGKTVTLTGINRAHAIFMQRYDTASFWEFNISLPMGATGTIYRRATNGYGGSEFSLNAPAAGTAQVLTINNTGGDNNANGVTYRLLVIGSST